MAGGRPDHGEVDERGHRRRVLRGRGDKPAPRGAPPHTHSQEEETLYVLEGEVEFLLGEDTIPAGAGSCVYVPRGALHTFKNVGTSPSRVLFVLNPGGFEKFFLEAGEPAPKGSSPPKGEPDVGRIVEIGQKYGLEIPPPPPGQ